MKYLMLVCRDLTIELGPDDRAQIGPAVTAWVAEMEGRGVRLQGHTLAPVEDATTVSVRSGEVMVGNGPLVETTQPIAGFNIIECSGLEEAIEVSTKHPVARFGKIELRALEDG